jgi:hypothetical protein
MDEKNDEDRRGVLRKLIYNEGSRGEPYMMFAKVANGTEKPRTDRIVMELNRDLRCELQIGHSSKVLTVRRMVKFWPRKVLKNFHYEKIEKGKDGKVIGPIGPRMIAHTRATMPPETDTDPNARASGEDNVSLTEGEEAELVLQGERPEVTQGRSRQQRQRPGSKRGLTFTEGTAAAGPSAGGTSPSHSPTRSPSKSPRTLPKSPLSTAAEETAAAPAVSDDVIPPPILKAPPKKMTNKSLREGCKRQALKDKERAMKERANRRAHELNEVAVEKDKRLNQKHAKELHAENQRIDVQRQKDVEDRMVSDIQRHLNGYDAHDDEDLLGEPVRHQPDVETAPPQQEEREEIASGSAGPKETPRKPSRREVEYRKREIEREETDEVWRDSPPGPGQSRAENTISEHCS